MKKLIIGSGSREWRDPKPIKNVLLNVFKEFDTIEEYFHGTCRGFDQLSDFILRRMGFTNIKKFPAQWTTYGFSAGNIRNEEMLDTGLEYYSREDILVICMPLPNSIGTLNMIQATKERGIDVRVYDQNGDLT